jgi:peptidyl-prolyl cis-trans isomerase A (cyclophilin A)
MSNVTHLVAAALLLQACDSPVTPEPTPQNTTPKPTVSQTKPAATPAPTQPAAVQAKGPFPESTNPAMTDPKLAAEKAPPTFTVRFETTFGDFNVSCTRDWAPNGVDRFYNLAKIGYFNDVAFFRAVDGFMVQFGIHGNPDVSKHWRDANLAPDPVKEKNARGMVSFAMAGSPDTRSTQLFINFGDNSRLDGMGFAPICKLSDADMAVVDKVHKGYGEAPSAKQGQIQMSGNKFLRERFPALDYIKTVKLLGDDATPATSASAATSAAPVGSGAPSGRPESSASK